MQNDTQKAIDLIIQCEQLTIELIETAMKNYVDNLKTKSVKAGKASYSKLTKQGKLENIEISDKNLKDFQTIARKYRITYAIKVDRSQSPPVHHVFFQSKDEKSFKRAFDEYVKSKVNQSRQATISNAQRKEMDKQIERPEANMSMPERQR